MTKAFKRIGIIGRMANPGAKDTLVALVHYLQTLNQEIIIEEETAEGLPKHSLPTTTRSQLGHACDLIIVIGGDGSLLSAAHAITDSNVPVLGINRGSLGFLTDIRPNELAKIKNILEGHYILDQRFLLTAQIEKQGELQGQSNALNEIAIIPSVVPHMIEFEIYINEQFVCSQRSDGLIIATPTGSTAYALSGGGPILHPELDAIVLVPMFPHTLSSRPIVIEGNQLIKIVLAPHNKSAPRVSCDGQTYLNAPPGSQVLISKKTNRLQLIHPKDYDYYATLRSKLDWGKKLSYNE